MVKISLRVIGIRKRFWEFKRIKDLLMNISISEDTNAWCHAWAYGGKVVIDVITNFIAISDDSGISRTTFSKRKSPIVLSS